MSPRLRPNFFEKVHKPAVCPAPLQPFTVKFMLMGISESLQLKGLCCPEDQCYGTQQLRTVPDLSSASSFHCYSNIFLLVFARRSGLTGKEDVGSGLLV